jgi:hypothetical protein
MSRKEKVRLALFGFVLMAAIVAMAASARHTAEALAWANDDVMPQALAATFVVLDVALVALAVLLPPGGTRTAVFFGMLLIQVVNFTANLAAGGLRTETRMPTSVADFFGLSVTAADHVAAVLYAGVLPTVVGIAAYACTKTADGLLSEPAANPDAVHLLEKLERGFSNRAS